MTGRSYLAIAGIAAAVGAYALYTSDLERNDAVQRARRERQLSIAMSENRDPEHIAGLDGELAETDVMASTDEASKDEEVSPSQGLRGLLYYIAEEDAKRNAYQHRGITCEECGENPIRNIRWHCLNCPDFDLCSTCEASTQHAKTHIFAKIKIPIPVLSQPTKEMKLWYPGDPRKIHRSLDRESKRRLCDEHGFDEPQIDALYDQFTCMANVPWADDPIKIQSAIDRRAFNKAMRSDRWPKSFKPNAMYDRMFAFYDVNGDGLIGFSEFVFGLAYLRGPRRFEDLVRAIQGFDTDGDGYVDRHDFLRLLKAKFAIQKLLVTDMTDSSELEQTQTAMTTLRSSQPISSTFSEHDIPPGTDRVLSGKDRNMVGDLVPRNGAQTILGDEHASLQEDCVRDQRQFRDATNRMQARLRDVTSSDPLDEDVMWHVTEDGLNQVLDRLFAAREKEDRNVETELISAAEDSQSAYEAPSGVSESQGFRGDVMRTDSDDPQPQAAHSSSSSVWNGYRMPASSPLVREPSILDEEMHPLIPKRDSATPGPYAEPNKRQRQLDERGGRGRLSSQEVESIVVSDATKELRGLVKSWLEWASF